MKIWSGELALRATWWLSSRASRRLVAGVKVRALTQYGPEEESRFLNTVARALELVRDVDIGRFLALRNGFSGVLISEFVHGPVGFYSFDTHLCIIHPRYLDHGAGASDVAATLVHEVMHARIYAAGIRSVRWQERVEKLCISAEIAFARKLQDRRIETEARSRWASVAELYSEKSLLEADLRGVEEWKGFRWIQRSMLRRLERRRREVAERAPGK